MGSKAIVFLGLLVAMVLLISSEVAARDLAETTNAVETSKGTEAEPAQVGGPGGYGPVRGRRCRHGCCRRGYYVCLRCCVYEGEAVEADFNEAETHN